MPDNAMERRAVSLNKRAPRTEASYVLYWAQMNRRVESNHALAYAADLANQWKLPLLVYEGLTCSYPYANDRLHSFILAGVPETARRLKKRGIGYAFYLRKSAADPNDKLYEIAKDAAAIVTDDYPAFIARRHNASVPERIEIPYIAVDSSCVVPMSLMTKREYAAYSIRPKIRRFLPEWLKPAPEAKPKRPYRLPPPAWHTEVEPDKIGELVDSCQIDHSIKPSLSFHGGRLMAEKHLQIFLDRKLHRYARNRNEPSAHATSDLSPYLHFGQISSLEVALAVTAHAAEHKLIADEFLEELIVRRELAFNFARFSEDPESIASLPQWALKTLADHDGDTREFVYSAEQFERAQTHDALWNAAQKELLVRGKIHGYYRMYWGKKIIEWSETHAEALRIMIYLHDRYALDGRDPNTYTNILWCFGLHDRPWKTRAVFGSVRFMSQAGMRRKTDTEAYLREIETLERTGTDPFRVE